MTQELMNDLLGLLENEQKVYEGILELSKKKTSIVVEGKVSELEHIVKLEQALVLQISKIDKQRSELLEKDDSQKKLDKKSWNVSELKNLANPEQIKRLQKYQDGMAQTLRELNEVNQLNSKLITNSLEFIDFSLNIFSAADMISNNYGNKGDTINKEKKNILDIRL